MGGIKNPVLSASVEPDVAEHVDILVERVARQLDQQGEKVTPNRSDVIRALLEHGLEANPVTDEEREAHRASKVLKPSSRPTGLKLRAGRAVLLSAALAAMSTAAPHEGRRGRDSNPRYCFQHTRFPVVHLKPLGHLSCFVRGGV